MLPAVAGKVSDQVGQMVAESSTCQRAQRECTTAQQ